MSLFFINDGQIIERIAKSCQKKRLSINMSQATLAKKANLSIATVKKFEGAQAPSFKTIIAILRSLGEIDRLQSLILGAEDTAKDIFLDEHTSKKIRQRASHDKN